MRTAILSWLLHHANRYHKHENFYLIKADVLKRHAILIGNDYQRLPGAKCYTCNGSGVYIGHYWPTGTFKDTCRRCGGDGWYRLPVYVTLRKYQFGRYTFHIPVDRNSYIKPPENSLIIEGYVSHQASNFSYLTRMIVFLMYDFKGYRKQWRFGWGGGWYPNPGISVKKLFNNLVHLVKNGTEAIPIKMYRHKKIQLSKPATAQVAYDNEDLPF